MASVPTLAANATKAQALAYLGKYFGNVTYHNSQPTPYEGMGYAQLYSYIEQHNPQAAPHDIAVAVADLLLSSAYAATVGQAVTAGGNALGDVATGVQTASYLPSWATGLARLLSDLTSGTTWLRLAEGVLGVVLIAVGVAHMTRAVPIATHIAKAVA